MAKVAVRQDRMTSNISASKLRTKKRSRDISRTVVTGLVAVVLVQAVAALYLSPIFAVTPDAVTVKASPLCSEAQIRSFIQPDLPRSIVRLPVARWTDAICNLPVVKSAKITTSFPNRIFVEVKDRQPLLVSELGMLGSCVLDSDLVPFRLAEPTDVSLPSLVVQSGEVKPELGVSISDTAHVNGVKAIMKWLNDHRDISVVSVNIQNQHLSFIMKPSNVTVLLGTPRKLDEKLDSLEILIEKRPDLLSSRKYAAVNLFSDEYPALVLRSNSGEKSAVP